MKASEIFSVGYCFVANRVLWWSRGVARFSFSPPERRRFRRSDLSFGAVLRRFLISPPFGNYLGHCNAFSVKGSYTVLARRGYVRRAFQTLRPIRGGWVNRIGLRNPGIDSIAHFSGRHIYSLAALHAQDWEVFWRKVPRTCAVEINLGCPNAKTETSLVDQVQEITRYAWHSVKVSPHVSMDTIDPLLRAGITCVHASNTLPVETGGESGKRLKPVSLRLVRKLRRLSPKLRLIGGGGIYTGKDIEDYASAGADMFSIATAFFRLWNGFRLLS